jgi:ribosomal protein L29
MGQAQRVDQFSKLRRDIARIKTLLAERAVTNKAS